MKRLIAIMLALLLFLGAVPAAADGADLSYAQIIRMTQHMCEMATGDYLDIQGVPEELQQTAREWAEGIGGTPRMVIRADVMNAAYMVNTRASFFVDPDVIRMEAESHALHTIVSWLTAYAAMEAAVTESTYETISEINSLINAQMIYAEEGAAYAYGLYIVLYDGAAPIVIVSFSENGAVQLSGKFLPSERLAKCANSGQVSMWLLLNGFPMTCTEVAAE
ncbi:MAG: hypothetical protein IJZ74_08005 [Clostridia bacterium]|nr:hypothetical protein [Clostridia bacterium]